MPYRSVLNLEINGHGAFVLCSFIAQHTKKRNLHNLPDWQSICGTITQENVIYLGFSGFCLKISMTSVTRLLE